MPKTSELVADELRRRIVTGELQEGDQLPAEAVLIEEFGISRPTMREAIRILEAERLISLSRGARGGARVHLPKMDLVARYAGLYLQSHNVTVENIYEARILIEPTAVKLTAKRRDPEVIARLNEIINEMDAHVDDKDAYAHLVIQFHMQLMEGSGNEALSLIGRVLLQITEEHISSLGNSYGADYVSIGIKRHHKLLNLIEEGDTEGAEKHIWKYLNDARKILRREYGAESTVELIT